MKNIYPARWRNGLSIAFLLPFVFFIKASSQNSFILSPVITGLTAPIRFVNAGDGSKRLFVVEKAGAVKANGIITGGEKYEVYYSPANLSI